MKLLRHGVLALAAIGFLPILDECTSIAQTSNSEPLRLESIEWPRQYAQGGDTVIVYDPQVDSWKDYTLLSARSAVAVRAKGESEEIFGVVEYEVETEIDAEHKEVLFRNRKITLVRFKGIDDPRSTQAEAIVRRVVQTGQNIRIPLDFVLAQIENNVQRSIEVNMDPPPIVTAQAPAIMIMFMGKPEFKPIEGTDLQFCVNTNWDIMLHPGTGTYYLLNGEGWLATKNLSDGPWSQASTLPASLSSLPNDENWTEVRKHVPGKKIPVSAVFYTEQPSELIVFEGPLEYEDIEGTTLRYVTNTLSHVFQHKESNTFYVLTSGRWFRAAALEGPWTAATQDLPPDFAKIPADSPKGSVLISVPGTPEAKDAVLLTDVPQKSNVDPKLVSVTPVYDGDPSFVKIEGTSFYYAENSPYSVFWLNSKYYCCHEGIWFCATSPKGKWSVCTSVPDEIYTIPPTHPKHNVTYVYVYDSTPDVVVVGYTSGYTGVYVSSGVVVYGTAYPVYYTPYYYYHYYPYHYGYGCAMHYSYASGSYYRSAHAYGPYGGAGYGTAYNPRTGTYSRGAYAYGPYGERHGSQSYNPYTGSYAARGGGSTPYSSWDRGVVSHGGEWARGGTYSDSRGTVSGGKTSKGGAAARVQTDDGSAAVARTESGDVYASKDGDVYKRNEDGSWSSHEDGKWSQGEPKGEGAAATTRESGNAAQQQGTGREGASADAKSQAQNKASDGTKPQTQNKAAAGTTAKPQSKGSSAAAAKPQSSTQSDLNRQSQNRSRGLQNSGRSSGGSRGGGGRRR